MEIRSADAGMDPGAAGVFEGLGGYFNIFLHGTAEAANSSIFNDLCDLVDRFEIARAGDRESGFNNINSEAFQLKGKANFFSCIKFATWHLLAIAQGSVEDEYFVFAHL